MRRVVLLVVLCPAIAHAEVDARGSFTTRVPFEVPSFYGIAPSIGLAYAGGATGDAGAGWRLDAGSVITRTTATRGTPRFDASDTFWLDGEELIPCAASSTSPSCSTAQTAQLSGAFYSTRIESFARVQRDGERWTVWSPKGVRRLYDSGNGGVSYQLYAVIDPHGNQVHYTWACPTRACRLVMIDYGKASDAHPGVEIDLLYEARPDVRTVSTGLGRAIHDQRLRTIAVRGDGHLARAYKLSYVLSPETGASLLASVQQFASDASVDGAGTITVGVTPPLPAIRLTTESILQGRGAWAPHGEAQGLVIEDAPAGLLHHYPPQTELGTESSSATKPIFPSGALVGDFDGDRRSEALAWGVTNHCTTLELGVRLSTATEVGPLVTTTFDGVHESTPNCHPMAFAGDFDGDGREDVAIGVWPYLMVVYGRPDGQFAWGGMTSWSYATRECATGDVDGDGREDLVCRTAPDIVTYFGKTMLATPMAVEPAVEDGATGHFAIADVDGDGLADVVLAGPISIMEGR